VKLTDFICANAVKAELTARDKEGVIREMTWSLSDAGQIVQADYESVVKAVLKREALGTTVTAGGVAVAHGKHPGVQWISGAAAVCRPSVDFGSFAGNMASSVRFVILLVSPSGCQVDYLKPLSWIERQLQVRAFCRSLTRAKSASELNDLLDNVGKNQYS
jgi:mannitol/fructose-specific phosphotransferase system IIA component (Ntr-type)